METVYTSSWQAPTFWEERFQKDFPELYPEALRVAKGEGLEDRYEYWADEYEIESKLELEAVEEAQMVYTPFQFFSLPDYLQRKIMLEELDFQSIENLCEAARGVEVKHPGATKFFWDFCNNYQFWRDKFHYDFPRSIDYVDRHEELMPWAEDWKRVYRDFELNMPSYEQRLLEDVKGGDLLDIKDLLEIGVDPNIRDERGTTALLLASLFGHLEVVDELLRAGANPNIRGNRGQTPLMYASTGGFTKIVRLLLTAGADVNAQDEIGETALMGRRRVRVVQALLEAGADPNIRNEERATALIVASEKGYPEVVEKLLRAGADPNIQDVNERTALLTASDMIRQNIGHFEVIEKLLRAGANPNIQDNWGDTALMRTITRRGLRGVDDDIIWNTIWEIIKYKPDPDIQNSQGETAVDLAKEEGFTSVVDTLLYLRREKETP